MKAMVFAAGLGTRLGPLTDDRPKALVRVGGRPMLDTLLDKLYFSGFDDIVVNVHHFPDMMISHLDAWGKEFNGSKSFPGQPARIRISDERESLLETGGALKKAAPLLRGSGDFLVHNVDILSDVDLKGFHDTFACSRECKAMLLVTDRPSSRNLLFDDEMRLVGWRNNTTGQVRSPFPELDPSKCRAYAFSGIHIISENLLDAISLWPEERFSVTDFYIGSCASQKIMGYLAEGAQVLDLGKMEALEKADRMLEKA